MKQVLVILFVIIFGFQKQVITLLPPLDFARQTGEKNVQLIDVRTSGEYKQGHIKNAINIHIYDKSFQTQVLKFDKKKPILVYCKAGGRSAEAVLLLKELGFLRIIELQGGTDAWIEDKFELVK